jgi:hypothetical protein
MRITVYAPDELTPKVVHATLCLATRQVPDLDAIAKWSKYELLLAYDWAVREHLAASDNPVQRRQRPTFTLTEASQ